MIWRDLKTDPPTGDRCILLFPSLSDVGHLYSVSNPDYARINGLRHGHTHWADIEPHPQEAAAEAKVEEIRRAEHDREKQYYDGFQRASENIVEALKELVPDRPAVAQAIEARFVKS